MADYLDLFNLYIMDGLQLSAGFYFYTGLMQKKVRLICHILFAVLGTAVLTGFHLDGLSGLLAFILLLLAAGKLLRRENNASDILYAVITAGIMNLCFGLAGSLSCILYPAVLEKSPMFFGFILMAAGNMLALILSVLCYLVIRHCCAGSETADRKYAFMILMPVLLIFLGSEYVNTGIYGNTVSTENHMEIAGVIPYQMLFMQTLGIVSLFCMMSAYKKLAESFRLGEQAALLEMQAHFLNQYVSEAKQRYEKTKSFRHDIKNHITVVSELLHNKETEAAFRYIRDMEKLTADLSFPVSTDHPVIDILLANKLGAAQDSGVQVQCSLSVPYPCGVSDMDFCIILGNALDNAVSACNRLQNGKQKFIHVTGNLQGDFLLIQIENSCTDGETVRSGTGLANIRAAAEKYHGAAEIRTEGGVFVLSVLVVIPQQPESISQQTGLVRLK